MLWSAAMHTHKLACLLTFVLAVPAAAEIPYSCQGGTAKRITVRGSPVGQGLHIDAFIPNGLDPVTLEPATLGYAIKQGAASVGIIVAATQRQALR